MLVDAIETLFHPVLVYNNKEGADAALLARFKEPAWNNPVVRFLDVEGADVLPRADGVWELAPLVARTVASLRAAKREVPAWLDLFAADQAGGASGRATFAMHCFWEGEGHLGGIDGVLHTRAGWLEGKEVVEVAFDPSKISYAELIARAQRLECASTVYARDDAQLATARAKVAERAVRSDEAAKDAEASDQKHALRASPLRSVPMTAAQAAKVNAALAAGQDPMPWLAPSQREAAARVGKIAARRRTALPDLFGREDLAVAFAELQTALAAAPKDG